MEDIKKKRPNFVASLFLLELSVMVYSFSTLAGKMASEYEFLSWNYIFYFGLEFCILAVYALLWQQVIKRFQLSIAYANKALGLMWGLLWNYVLFNVAVSKGQIIGVVIVMLGVIIMNMGEGSHE